MEMKFQSFNHFSERIYTKNQFLLEILLFLFYVFCFLSNLLLNFYLKVILLVFLSSSSIGLNLKGFFRDFGKGYLSVEKVQVSDQFIGYFVRQNSTIPVKCILIIIGFLFLFYIFTYFFFLLYRKTTKQRNKETGKLKPLYN